MRTNHLLFLCLTAVVLFSCQPLQEDILPADGVSFLSETKPEGHVFTRSEYNFIPGSLFDGVEEDYVVFSRKGRFEGGWICMNMVPWQYQDHSEMAPDKSFRIEVELDRSYLAREGDGYRISARRVSGAVHFDSCNGCLVARNTIPAEVSVSGVLTIQEDSASSQILTCSLEMSVKLSAGESLSLAFTEIVKTK